MSNIAPIKALYAAFATGDMPAALATMAPDIVWNEAENYRNKQTLITRSIELLEKETMDQDELASISAEILQKGGEQFRNEKGEGKAA